MVSTEFMEQWPKQRKTVKSKASCGKTRRGYGRKNAKQRINGKRKINFSLLGSNCNSINSKKESLYHAINVFKPSVITLLETKARRKGSIKIPGYLKKLETLGVGEDF